MPRYTHEFYNQKLHVHCSTNPRTLTRALSAVARPNGQPRQAGVARGVRGHAPPPPPREILNFSLSEMRFATFSGPFGNIFSIRVNLSGI